MVLFILNILTTLFSLYADIDSCVSHRDDCTNSMYASIVCSPDSQYASLDAVDTATPEAISLIKCTYLNLVGNDQINKEYLPASLASVEVIDGGKYRNRSEK